MIGPNDITQFSPGPWKEISRQNRIRVIEVENFNGFFEFVGRIGVAGSNDENIWRGQRRAEWEVKSTLARSTKPHFEDTHFFRFVRAIARCTNVHYDLSPSNPLAEENKLKVWSLGQHWGLATPLIDFTVYPFAALFFAFVEPDGDSTSKRSVYAFDTGMVPSLNYGIVERLGRQEFKRKIDNPPYDDEFMKVLSDYEGLNRQLMPEMIANSSLPSNFKERICTREHEKQQKKAMRLYRPLSNENPRIHSQGGWHVYPPDHQTLESWIKTHHAASELPAEMPVLTKILIPNKERSEILKILNRMGINYLSIFPDFEGAAKHCNLALTEGRLSQARDY